MDRITVNPFYIGNGFINYCIKQGWITLEFSEDKKLHYFLSETGADELEKRFGIGFDSPCSRNNSDEQH